MTVPTVIAHRGDAHNHSENSLAAFESALAGGVQHVECDLQLNASGTFVVLHDANLQRTHSRDLSVFDYSDGQAPSLPTVQHVMRLAADHSEATFYFEIKHDSIDRWGDEAVLEQMTIQLNEIAHHAIFCRSLEFAAKARQAGFRAIGVIVREWTDRLWQQLRALAPDYLVINIHRVPQREPLWPGDWRWAVYDVDDAETALAWAERGADFVISYNPIELQQQLQATSH